MAAPGTPRKKSNAVWWILGGVAALVVIGVGLLVMLIALASLGSNANNSNLNANRNANRNSNVVVNANTNTSNANANIASPTAITDNFSEQKWGVGTSPYGRIWYADDEYHMVSKERTWVVMYAPSDDYSTENARVSVAARSVSGEVPSAGFGLMVHCVQGRTGQLDDYALLIYPSKDDPEYQIIMHKAGTQSTLVAPTKSTAIRPGSAINQLEIRTRGPELSFYINGRFLTRINDNENFRRGRAGFYTSDVHEVAFDNLVISR